MAISEEFKYLWKDIRAHLRSGRYGPEDLVITLYLLRFGAYLDIKTNSNIRNDVVKDWHLNRNSMVKRYRKGYDGLVAKMYKAMLMRLETTEVKNKRLTVLHPEVFSETLAKEEAPGMEVLTKYGISNSMRYGLYLKGLQPSVLIERHTRGLKSQGVKAVLEGKGKSKMISGKVITPDDVALELMGFNADITTTARGDPKKLEGEPWAWIVDLETLGNCIIEMRRTKKVRKKKVPHSVVWNIQHFIHLLEEAMLTPHLPPRRLLD